MQVILGMILGAVLLVAGVYISELASDLDGRKRPECGQQPNHRQLGCGLCRLARLENARP